MPLKVSATTDVDATTIASTIVVTIGSTIAFLPHIHEPVCPPRAVQTNEVPIMTAEPGYRPR